MAKLKPAPARYVQPYQYPSPNIPLSAIRRFARKIAERFHPEKIILFGSYAYGKPHEESDVDLLVIMPTYDVINQSIRISLAFDSPFSLDLIVRTPKQVERGLKDNNWFLREIIEKGKTLYEAGNGKMGSQSRGRLARSPGTGSSKTTAVRSGLFSLPTVRRKVSKGLVARPRPARAKNT